MARSCLALASIAFIALLSPAVLAEPDAHGMHHGADPSAGHGGGHGAAAPRADDHAPIGVMGDHVHHAGDFMLSFRTGFMEMDGNRDGTSRESTSDVLRQFPVAPTDMTMQMYMLGAMYAPTDNATLMTMLPILRKDMNHKTRRGTKFRTRADGIGDVKLTGLVRLYEDEIHHVHANAGLSFPTGSVSQKDDTPMGRMRLPYPMQLGSGTWDLLPGLTYQGKLSDLSFGAQATGVVRTGRNTHGYRLGNQAQATGWSGYALLPWLNASLRAEYRWWGDIHGSDSALNPRVVPTADPDLRGGQRIALLVGMNVVVPEGTFRGNNFGFEFGVPVWQDLHGPQLETDWTLVAGWRFAF
jgi:hypothetical protein